MKRAGLVGGAVMVVVVMVGVGLGRAVGGARESARRSQCVGHLKWIIVHMLNYQSVHGSFPPGTIPNPGLPPERRLGWAAELWSVLGIGDDLKVDASKGWDDPANWPPKIVGAEGTTYVGRRPEDSADWVACPTDPAARRKERPLPLTYVGIAGLGADAPELPSKHPRAGVFGFDRTTHIEDIRDGTNQTMAVVETARDHGAWTAGGPSSVRGIDPATRPYLGRGRPFGGYHSGGANAAFADGSVRFLRESIDPRVLEALSTVVGGEPLPAGWDR
jgi:prepilin-type processing-associated H-X9-DG protein